MRRSLSNPIATFLMLVLTILWTIPTLGLFVTSIRPEEDASTTGWWTILEHPNFTLSNYNTVLFDSVGVTGGLTPYLVNSLVISIPATIFPLVLGAFAAYALAWIRFRGNDTIFFIVFALQVVPLQMALIPLLQFFSNGAHIGTLTIVPPPHFGGEGALIPYGQVWIAHTIFALPLAIFLLHNFIVHLPRDLMEAAFVDGATHIKIFRIIVVPLAAPAISSFAIFQFLWVWNDLLVALTFAGGTANVAPLTARLAQLAGGYGSRWELTTAGAFVSIIIPLVVFFALQRYFVRGLLAGSLKG
jgi:alpha-glucoside transport system permease protein